MAQKVKLTADAVVVPGPERIVRVLAASQEPLVGEPNQGDRKMTCTLCYERNELLFPGKQEEAHKSDCSWRLAREWVKANPA